MNENIKHILFATDGSEFSQGAQKLAIALAQRCGGDLTVMTIVLGIQDLEGVGTHNLRQQMENQAQEQLDAVAAAARSAGVACATRLAYGEEPHQQIVAAAAELNADLIVLGRRGKRGLARFMVGHATAKVAGNATCNVLVVPRAAQLWNKRMLVATDGSASSELATRVAINVARQCGLPLTVVSATSKSHSEERKAEAHAAVANTLAAANDAGVSGEGLVAEGRPDDVVIARAATEGADLIIVGSHGRTGLTRLLLGSISERIIGQAQCPVMVARAAV